MEQGIHPGLKQSTSQGKWKKNTVKEEDGERSGKAGGRVLLLSVAGVYSGWKYLLDYSIICNSRHFKGSQV